MAESSLEIRPLTKESSKDWDGFCLRSDDAWFWHTSKYLEFISRYKYQLQSKNLSFMIYNNGSIEAVCPLLLEAHVIDGRTVNEFSLGGLPAPVAALDNGIVGSARERRLKDIFEHIDELARQHSVARSSFRSVALAPRLLEPQLPAYYVLMEFGYVPIPWNTQIINLNAPLDEILAGVRREYRRIVGKRKDIEISVFGSSGITQSQFNGFWDMYHRVSDLTHDDTTRDLLLSWVPAGHGVLFGARTEGRYLGYAFVTTFKKSAYYMLGCNDPDFEEAPVGHAIQLKVIEWLKNQGYGHYETGYQFQHPLPYNAVSRKEIDISSFKRGFGGFTVPIMAGEKYYSRDYYVQVDSERARRYSDYLDEVADQART